MAVVLTVAAMWNAAGRGNYPDRELWRVDAYPAEQDLMLKSLSEISDWAQKNRQPLDLCDSRVTITSLGFEGLSKQNMICLPVDARPSTVTDQTNTLQLTAPAPGFYNLHCSRMVRNGGQRMAGMGVLSPCAGVHHLCHFMGPYRSIPWSSNQSHSLNKVIL